MHHGRSRVNGRRRRALHSVPSQDSNEETDRASFANVFVRKETTFHSAEWKVLRLASRALRMPKAASKTASGKFRMIGFASTRGNPIKDIHRLAYTTAIVTRCAERARRKFRDEPRKLPAQFCLMCKLRATRV